MFYPRFANSRLHRQTILASVAVASLFVAGAFGEGALTSHVAHAAAVTTVDLQGQPMPSFAPLIDRVKAAVVSVKVKIVSDGAASGSSIQMDNLPPEIQQFLKRFGVPNGATQNPQSVVMGEGSGFFISSDGFIVTNNHVVDHAKSVTVTMDDGKTLDAKVVGTDPKTDLALLKATQPGDYPFVTFAKAQPRIGDWVVAIGNTASAGQ